MKRINFFLTGLVALVVAGAIMHCNIETASGPTPYAWFDGNVVASSSSVAFGKGEKSFVIPAGLVMNSIGQDVTIRPVTGDSAFFMSGKITYYNRNNGTLTVDIATDSGSGTMSGWKIIGGKTATPIDSARQAYADLKFGLFFHFNMSTFDRCCCPQCYSVSGEWGKGKATAPALLFRPSKLDCGQWADAAKAAGCKYMVLVTKHHDGFCLWPSKLTDYSVKNATCTTDVVKQFCDSARSRGMRVGFYYSIRDLSNGINLSFIKGQLTELLTNYGSDILCLWFDGWGWDAGYKNVPYDTIRDCIRKIQPYCLIVENNHEYTTNHSDMLEWEMPIDGPPPITNRQPAEGNEPIRYSPTDRERCWFWHPEGNCALMPAQMIVNTLKNNNKGNAAYLLDLTPDTLGLIPQCQVDRMKEVGTMLGVGTPASYTGR